MLADREGIRTYDVSTCWMAGEMKNHHRVSKSFELLLNIP